MVGLSPAVDAGFLPTPERFMNRHSLAIYAALLTGLSGLAACGVAPSLPQATPMTARLSGAGEVPPVAGTGSAAAEARLDPTTRRLEWTVTHAGLSGPVTAAHFHGPAAAGENAGVALPLAGSLESPIRGSGTLSAAQVSDLMAGRWYLNLHTAAHPAGEVRGQVMLTR